MSSSAASADRNPGNSSAASALPESPGVCAADVTSAPGDSADAGLSPLPATAAVSAPDHRSEPPDAGIGRPSADGTQADGGEAKRDLELAYDGAGAAPGKAAAGESNPAPDSGPGPPPDGGWGWVLVACLFMVHVIVIGPQYCWGVYARYYAESNFFPGMSLTAITLIGSTMVALCPGFGPVSGRLAEMFDARIVCFVGGVMCFLGLLLASFSTAYWQTFLSQGVLLGLGQSVAYFPFMGTVVTWFSKRRGLAVGLAVSGTGIGGLALSPFTQYLINVLSVQWALRITALMVLAVNTVCAALLRTRYKAVGRGGKLFNFSYFRIPQFVMLWFSQFFCFFGFFLPPFFMSTLAATFGLSQNQGAIILGLTNLGSTLGRIVIGYLSDYVGHFNSFLSSALLAALAMLLIWPFMTTFGGLIFFGMFFSFNSGGFVSLMSTCLAEVVGIASISSAIGLLYSAGAFADLVGPPLAGMLIQTTTAPDGTVQQSYLGMMMFGGSMMFLAAAFIFMVRMKRAGWKIWSRV
ncbi:major facilitator superfamily domain-containing protein [Hyaloraphidium curvatum]|nr:major facilitator superfamily domain-containing protein [Hyaloraphidium curvatum]